MGDPGEPGTCSKHFTFAKGRSVTQGTGLSDIQAKGEGLA